MKRQQGSLANFGFSTSVARVRVRQDVGTEVGEGYTSPVLQIYAPKLLGQIQKPPHFLVGFLNFAPKIAKKKFRSLRSRRCTLKIVPLAALAEGMGYFSQNPENPTQREKKKANLTPGCNNVTKKKKNCGINRTSLSY